MTEDRELSELRQTGSFDRYELYVMQTLGDLKAEVRSLRDEIASLRRDFAVYRQVTDAEISAIKVKSGLIGAIVGFAGGLIGVVISLLLKLVLS